MPIVRKSKSDHHFNKLQERIENLKQVMQGNEPNIGIWNLYAGNEDDYNRDFTEIDQSELNLALSDLTGAINELKKAKTLKADKIPNPN